MSTTTSPGIYQIKVGPRTTYYGQSQNLQNRETSHLLELRKGTHNNRQLQRSFNRHGEGSCTFQPLLICEIDELNRYEQALLDAHHGTPGCANVAKDAEASQRGLKHSEETRAKMSEAHRARWADPEARERYTKSSKARWADPEHRKKVGEASKAYWGNPEARKKQSEAVSKPIEVTWDAEETTIFPSRMALGEHLGYASGSQVSEWLSGRKKIPKKHGILSVRKL